MPATASISNLGGVGSPTQGRTYSSPSRMSRVGCEERVGTFETSMFKVPCVAILDCPLFWQLRPRNLPATSSLTTRIRWILETIQRCPCTLSLRIGGKGIKISELADLGMNAGLFSSAVHGDLEARSPQASLSASRPICSTLSHGSSRVGYVLK